MLIFVQTSTAWNTTHTGTRFWEQIPVLQAWHKGLHRAQQRQHLGKNPAERGMLCLSYPEQGFPGTADTGRETRSLLGGWQLPPAPPGTGCLPRWAPETLQSCSQAHQAQPARSGWAARGLTGQSNAMVAAWKCPSSMPGDVTPIETPETTARCLFHKLNGSFWGAGLRAGGWASGQGTSKDRNHSLFFSSHARAAYARC